MKMFEGISDWLTYDEGRIKTFAIFIMILLPGIFAIFQMSLGSMVVYQGLFIIFLSVMSVTILYLFYVKPWVKKRKAEEQARQERLDKNIKDCKEMESEK